MEAARSTGERVEDLSQRTETTVVFANPDGTWTAESVSEPERVQDEAGVWHEVDTTLVADAAGLAPTRAASDLRLSAGGDRVFAAITQAGKRLEWRWPTTLPEPAVDGDTATYPDALPGVGDLVVTATTSGFTHNLVVHERPSGPVEVTIPVVTDGADLVESPSGEIAVETTNGNTLVAASQPLMWDSSEDADGDPAVAEVDASVGETPAGTPTLTLTADEEFLADPGTVYPVTVDPAFTTNPSVDTWVQSADGTSSHTSDEELRVGTNDAGAHKSRSFLKFANIDSGWAGRRIITAQLLLRNFYSDSCTNHEIRAERISQDWTATNLTWANQPNVGNMYDSYFKAQGSNSNCPDGDATWSVTNMVTDWAKGDPNHGIRLKAVNETSNNSWRKYRSDNYGTAGVRPRLVVTYNTPPNLPTNLAISPCLDDCSPRVTPTLTPTLSAKGSDADPGTTLTEEFQVATTASTTPIGSGTATGVASGSTGSWTVPAGVLADNTGYRFRVRAKDPSNDYSAWTSWVGFSTGTDQPPTAPTQLGIEPCASCDPATEMWVTPSANPELTAVVEDPDSDTVEGMFEVRALGGTEVLASGADVVTTGETARFAVPADVLTDGGEYQFRAGARINATSVAWSGWRSFRTEVDPTDPATALRLAEPLVVYDTGAVLSWTAYKDPSSAQGDNLVEYQVLRGCTTPDGQPTAWCAKPAGTTYDPADVDAGTLEVVGTLDAGTRRFTDETAEPSTTGADGHASSYVYWIGARTQDDLAASPDRDAQVATNPQPVTTPLEGRVRRIITRATDDTTDPAYQDVVDSTLAGNRPDENLPRPQDATGAPGAWLQVGRGHPTYGEERAVARFDLSAINAGLTVTSAELEFTQVDGSGTGNGTMEVHALKRGFVEDEVTWNNANATTTWPGGGDLDGSVLATGPLASSPSLWTFAGTALTQKTQAWVNDPAGNHGLALLPSSTTTGLWASLASSESGQLEQRPRLVVEHLRRSAADTFLAPQLQERYLPGTVTTVPVTVTNTTNAPWPASGTTPLRLSYRWTLPELSEDVTSYSADREVTLGEVLDPGESVTVDLTLRAPIQSSTGQKVTDYDLFLDLREGSTWWSQSHPYTTKTTLDRTERDQRLCAVVATGLLCPNRIVDAPTSSELGLEEFASYATEATGAGSQLLTNVHNGNVVWSYDALTLPSVGPSFFLRLAYNSQDRVDHGAGYNWSVQPATLSQLGSRLVINANNSTVTLTDGDGTTHTWTQIDGTNTYRRPAGIGLDLRYDSAATVARRWVFSRPDGTRFYFREGGSDSDPAVPTAVVDHNGNTMTFGYDTGWRLTTVTDDKGRQVAQLGWESGSNPHLLWIKDLSGRAIRLTYNASDQVTAVEHGGGFNATTGFTGPVKKFDLTYTTGQSGSALLASVSDPRDATTDLAYYVANETYPAPDTANTPSFIEGWPKTVTDRGGRVTSFRYFDADTDKNDGENLRVEVTDENTDGPDERTTYLVDGYGRTTQVTDANANAGEGGATTEDSTDLVWDADHHVTRLTAPNGAVSRWRYDPVTGYPTRLWDPEAVRTGGEPTQLGYNNGTPCSAGALCLLTSVTTSGGRTTSFGHDTSGNLTSVTDPLQRTTSYSYDSDGRLIGATDARTNTTGYSYDPARGGNSGYPTTITPPTGIAPTAFVYDEVGNVTRTEQTSEGQTLVTTAVYDHFGRPTSITTPGAQSGPRTTETGYDLNDNMLTSTAANGAQTVTVYNAEDLPTQVTYPNNGGDGPRVATYTYDAMGRLEETVSPQGNKTTDIADDHTITYTYDRLGQTDTVTQPLAGPDGEAAVVGYDYDLVGNLVAVTDPRQYVTRTGYDHNNRPISTTDPAGFASRTVYDPDGQVVEEIDQRGNSTDYTYDAAGQPIAKQVTHTPTGERTQTWITEYDYDAVGNLVTTWRPREKGTERKLAERTVYDANNQVIKTEGPSDPDFGNGSYADPAITRFKYDDLGRMIQQAAPTRVADDDSPGIEWTTIDYYRSGEVRSSTDPWNITTRYEYSTLGLQTSRSLTGDNGQTSRTMTWAYYPDGSLKGRDDAAAPGPAAIGDNADPGALATGTWSTETTGDTDAHVGADYRQHGPDTPASGSFAWTLSVPADGTYRIEVSCPPRERGTSARSTTASYRLQGTSAGNAFDRTVTLDQADCADSGRLWHTLDKTSNLAGASTLTVTLVPSGDGPVVADAVRLMSVNVERSFAYRYDADGRQTEADDTSPGAIVDAYTTGYDAVGRPDLVTEVGSDGQPRRTTSYGYDIAGNLTRTETDRPAYGTAPDDGGNLAASRYTTYQWDARGLVEQVTTGKNAADARTWAYTYDPRGMVAKITKPGGTDGASVGNEISYAYHETGLLRRSVERTPAGDLVASHHLWFNPDGDRTKETSRLDDADSTGYLDQTARYTYTPARQLAEITKSGQEGKEGKHETYDYDAAGNITTQKIGNITTDNQYEHNRLTTSTSSEGYTNAYRYDAFGRLDRVTVQADGSQATNTIQSYTYDGFDRIIRDTQTPVGSAEIVTATSYDVLDRAVLRTVTKGTQAPEKTRYGYLGLTDQVAVEEEPDPDGTGWKTAKSYHYGPDGRPLILHDTTPGAGSTADHNDTYLYSINPHGDTELLTNPEDGTAKATYRYLAYGSLEEAGTTGLDSDDADPAANTGDTDSVNPYRFNSKRFDPATDKYDMGFRTYDPGLNRFLTRDMYNGALNDLALGTDPWNTNRYAFAGGNPITRIELDGHIATCASGGVACGTPIIQGPGAGAAVATNTNTFNANDRAAGTRIQAAADTSLANAFVKSAKTVSAPIVAGAATGTFDAFLIGNPVTAVPFLLGAPINPFEEASEAAGINTEGKPFSWSRVIGIPIPGVGAASSAGRVASRGGIFGIKSLAGWVRGLTANAGRTGARTCLRSFAGSTLVLMADGTKKPIEDVEVGDRVVATDPETGERVVRKVTRVWVHDDQVLDLIVDGEVITTTEDHLFWSVTDQRFERADELTAGEVVLGDDGGELAVSDFRLGTERTALAYNLSIAGVHTYHVGDEAILVHNDCAYTPAGGFADSDLDEVAQAVYQHVGAGDVPGRPNLTQIQEALTRGVPEALEQGDGGIAQVINYRGVRVIINEDSPWKSTAYFPGGG